MKLAVITAQLGASTSRVVVMAMMVSMVAVLDCMVVNLVPPAT